MRRKGQDRRTGGGHGIGGGGIATHARAIENHPVEIVEKPIVHQPVDVRPDGFVAKPVLRIGDQRQMRPAPAFADVKGKGHARVTDRADAEKRFKGDEQHVMRGLDKDRRMVLGQIGIIPIRLSDHAKRFQPVLV